jgi:gamma-glutamyltranspeptidase/glutathione hydrolase
LKIEARISEDVRAGLKLKGHDLSIRKDFDLYFGGAQGITIDPETGVLRGGADPRRDGKAIGY